MTEPTGMAGRSPGYTGGPDRGQTGVYSPRCSASATGGPAGREAALRRVGRGGLATATAGVGVGWWPLGEASTLGDTSTTVTCSTGADSTTTSWGTSAGFSSGLSAP